MNTKLSLQNPVHAFLCGIVIGIIIISIIQISNQNQFFSQCTMCTNISNKLTYSNVSHYNYYICTQVWNETNEHMIEWIEHQIFRLGFHNICMISVEEPLDQTLVTRYKLATITKKKRAQEWKYCLECFTDPPMRPQDLLMLQDIDEFLNVQRSDAVSSLYDTYDRFHFTDLRYGYVYEKDEEMKDKSLLETNVYRRSNENLGEYIHPKLEELFGCNNSACQTTSGKEMIKVGAIQELGTHYHTTNNRSSGRSINVDMKHARLNHYCMRTRENSLITGAKWNKNGIKTNLIKLNNFFKVVYDPTVIYSKKLQ